MSARCRFYYEDSYRRSPKRECRLIQLNPASEPWEETLCSRCPVPEILGCNPCSNLALEAEVTSRWGFFRRVAVFAVCTVRMQPISDPRTCSEGCTQFKPLY